MSTIETLYDRLAFVRARISNIRRDLVEWEQEEKDLTDQIALKIVESK